MTSNVPRPADFRGVLKDGRMSVVLREVLGYSVYTLLLLGRSAVYPPATKLTKLTDADADGRALEPYFALRVGDGRAAAEQRATASFHGDRRRFRNLSQIPAAAAAAAAEAEAD